MADSRDITEPTAGLGRRSIVKGAAWSLPVIAAAIAAPAASASAPSAVVAFSANATGLPWTQLNGGGKAVAGAGPVNFAIQNGAGAITGPVSGTITISPNNPSAPIAKGLGVKAITNGLNIVHTASANAGMANTIVTTFSLTAGIGSSSYLAVPITFGIEIAGGLKSYTDPHTYTAALVLRDATNTQIGQTALGTLSTNFS